MRVINAGNRIRNRISSGLQLLQHLKLFRHYHLGIPFPEQLFWSPAPTRSSAVPPTSTRS
jgi:hypothetical protein